MAKNERWHVSGVLFILFLIRYFSPDCPEFYLAVLQLFVTYFYLKLMVFAAVGLEGSVTGGGGLLSLLQPQYLRVRTTAIAHGAPFSAYLDYG